MRISTGMIYEAGKTAVQNKTGDLLRVQQQLATGKRILRPSDDPVAAAHALEVTQSESMNTQFAKNQQVAKDVLALSEGNLQGIQDLYQRVHELAVQLGNTGTLNDANRKTIAAELRQRFDQLLHSANETDGLGSYLYSGYKGDVMPFTGNADIGVTYHGDDGQRLQRISASGLVAISDAGNDIFMAVRNDSVPFATDKGADNRGTGVIGTAVVTDQSKWNSNLNPKNFTVKFAVDPVTSEITYDIIDDEGYSVLSSPSALATGTVPLPGTGFISGQTISLKSTAAGGADYGASFVITGSPSDGDSFIIRPTAPQSVFKTIGDLIAAAERPWTQGVGVAGAADLSVAVDAALSNIQAAQENLSKIQTGIGARMNVIDSIADQTSHRDLNYKETLSHLQELDYTAAITDMNKQQVTLQAAQKSYVNIAQLSLFNYI